jgi:hypothetical protein
MVTANSAGHRGTAELRQFGFVLGFLPWIVFSVVSQRLAANGVAWSAVIAVVVTLVSLVIAHRRHGPKLLNLASLLIFAAMAVAGFVGGPAIDQWLFEWGRPLVGVVLGVFVLAMVPVMPFTAEYARQSTPREYWDSPTFRRINRILSAAWGAALIVMGAAALLVTALDAQATSTDRSHLVDLLLNWVVPIAVLWATIRFTITYPDRAKTANADPRKPDHRGSS